MHDYPTPSMIAANEAGYEAAMDALPRERNPHADGTDEHFSWEAGWLQGRGDLRNLRLSDRTDGYHVL